MSTSSAASPAIPRDPVFATTHWSVVQTAGQPDTFRSAAALEKLCRTYWYPLYAYARRRGQSPADAQDSTQAFFARLLERNWVGDARRERGRFRTFLLTAMSRFLADEWDKVRAQKRGGGRLLVPLQLDTAETRYGQEPVDTRTPEQAFDRRIVTRRETAIDIQAFVDMVLANRTEINRLLVEERGDDELVYAPMHDMLEMIDDRD